MGSRYRTIEIALVLASALPLWIGLFFAWRPQPPLSPVEVVSLVLMYGALLLAWCTGARWGAARENAAAALVLGLPVLPAGMVVMIFPPLIGCGLLIAGFLALALWDYLSSRAGHLPERFTTWRIILAGLCIIPLTLILARLI
ncbi:MAG TPA: DUF3429 family protein [Rhizobiales bacterium]|nr:DUF3429 family protein [Hyphomicrobiales bacterium]